MGFKTFTAKFDGMRKEYRFVVYPVSQCGNYLIIQSDRAIGRFHIKTGEGKLYKGSNPYSAQLQVLGKNYKFPPEVVQKALECSMAKGSLYDTGLGIYVQG